MASISKDDIERLYVEQGLSQQEVAERLGYKSRQPVRTALDEYDINSHTRGGNSADASWNDPETLREFYHGEKMSLREVGDELGCSAMRVQQKMDEFDIERRSPTHTRDPAHFHLTSNGYEAWKTSNSQVSVHRLACVAWFGLDEVVDKEVHHINEIPWDNRQSNLIPLTREEHRKAHDGKLPPFPK